MNRRIAKKITKRLFNGGWKAYTMPQKKRALAMCGYGLRSWSLRIERPSLHEGEMPPTQLIVRVS